MRCRPDRLMEHDFGPALIGDVEAHCEAIAARSWSLVTSAATKWAF